MKKTIILVLFLGLFLPNLSFAQPLNPEKINSDIKIDSLGNVVVQNAKITLIAGDTIYARLFWGESSIRMTIKTGKANSITKKYGELLKVSDMKVGDRINIEGYLEDGADSLTLYAKSVKNLSNEQEAGKFSGTIIGPTTGGYNLKTDEGETIKLSMNSSVVVEKGNRTLGFYDIKTGDRVLNVEGVFNHADKTLETNRIKIYIDLSVFKARNYQGTLKSLAGVDLPTTATVTVDGQDYTVKLMAKAAVLNNKRAPTRLSRFVIGDNVRFYGAIPEGDELRYVIGEVIRNIDL
jgi:hypothetical protein